MKLPALWLYGAENRLEWKLAGTDVVSGMEVHNIVPQIQ